MRIQGFPLFWNSLLYKNKYKPIQVFYERVSITGIEEDSDKKAMPIVPTIMGKQETMITLKNQVAGLTPTSSPAT